MVSANGVIVILLQSNILSRSLKKVKLLCSLFELMCLLNMHSVHFAAAHACWLFFIRTLFGWCPCMKEVNFYGI